MKEPKRPIYPTEPGVTKTKLGELDPSNINIGRILEILELQKIKDPYECYLDVETWASFGDVEIEMEVNLIHAKVEGAEEYRKRVAKYFEDSKQFEKDMAAFNKFIEEKRQKEEYKTYLALKQKYEKELNPSRGWKDKEV